MTMINRVAAPAPVYAVLTDMERLLLNHLVPKSPATTVNTTFLPDCITNIARLGGYLARKNDPPPVSIVMWRGFSRLTGLTLEFQMARDVGI